MIQTQERFQRHEQSDFHNFGWHQFCKLINILTVEYNKCNVRYKFLFQRYTLLQLLSKNVHQNSIKNKEIIYVLQIR